MAKGKIRRNCRGRIDDAGFALMQDWILHEQPRPSFSEIARRLNCSIPTVLYWRNRKDPPSKTVFRPPPRRAHDPVMVARVLELARKRTKKTGRKVSAKRRSVTIRAVTVVCHPTATSIAKAFAQVHKHRVSPWTVRRILKKNGFRVVRRGRAPCLSTEQKAARVICCRRLLAEKKIMVWSDESLLDTNDHVGRMWLGPGETPLARWTAQGGDKVLVHCFVGTGIKRLTVLPSGTRLTTDSYIDLVLKPNLDLLRRKDIIFQFDNARCHVSGATLAWLRKNKVNFFPSWSANSPDISFAEFPWSLLKSRVSQHGAFSWVELRDAVLKEWEALPQPMLDAAVAKWPNRLRQCIKNGGGTVH